MVCGISKKSILESILNEESENSKSPVRTILEESKGDVLIMCDQNAFPKDI